MTLLLGIWKELRKDLYNNMQTIIALLLAFAASTTFGSSLHDTDTHSAIELTACSPYTENPPMYDLCAKPYRKVNKCRIETEQAVFTEENIQKLREEQLQEMFFEKLRRCLERENNKEWE